MTSEHHFNTPPIQKEAADEIERLRQAIKEPSATFWQNIHDTYGTATVIEAQHAWIFMADSILGENSKCVGRCKCGALFALNCMCVKEA